MDKAPRRVILCLFICCLRLSPCNVPVCVLVVEFATSVDRSSFCCMPMIGGA